MAAEALPAELRRQLDIESVRPIVEYVADRLGLIDGHASLEIAFDGGAVRRAWVKRGPMGVVELESLAARDAPLA